MPWKRGVYTAEPTHHLHITSTPPPPPPPPPGINNGSHNGLLPDSTKPITWTNVDLSILSSLRSSALGPVPGFSGSKISLKITLSKILLKSYRRQWVNTCTGNWQPSGKALEIIIYWSRALVKPSGTGCMMIPVWKHAPFAKMCDNLLGLTTFVTSQDKAPQTCYLPIDWFVMYV